MGPNPEPTPKPRVWNFRPKTNPEARVFCLGRNKTRKNLAQCRSLLIERVKLINGGVDLSKAFEKIEKYKNPERERLESHARKVRLLVLGHFREKYNFPSSFQPPSSESIFKEYLEKEDPKKLTDPGWSESWKQLPKKEKSKFQQKARTSRNSFNNRISKACQKALEDQCWLALTGQEINQYGCEADIQVWVQCNKIWISWVIYFCQFKTRLENRNGDNRKKLP